MPASIILVGLPGAGKTTIGKELAKKLDFAFLDTDLMIEELEGFSVSEIFETRGEDYFRQLETSLIKSLLGVKNKVISVGGGAFQKEENRRFLNEIGRVVYLYAPVDVLWDRLKDKSGRPLLECENPLEKLQNLFDYRHNLFETADCKLDTTGLNQNAVLEELLKVINAKNS